MKSPQELLADVISDSLTELNYDDLDEKSKEYIRKLADLIDAKFCQKVVHQQAHSPSTNIDTHIIQPDSIQNESIVTEPSVK